MSLDPFLGFDSIGLAIGIFHYELVPSWALPWTAGLLQTLGRIRPCVSSEQVYSGLPLLV